MDHPVSISRLGGTLQLCHGFYLNKVHFNSFMIHQDENNNDLCVDQKGWGLFVGGGSLHIHFLDLNSFKLG